MRTKYIGCNLQIHGLDSILSPEDMCKHIKRLILDNLNLNFDSDVEIELKEYVYIDETK